MDITVLAKCYRELPVEIRFIPSAFSATDNSVLASALRRMTRIWMTYVWDKRRMNLRIDAWIRFIKCT